MQRTWKVISLFAALASVSGQDCACQQIDTVQDLYNTYDVVFVGRARVVDGAVLGKVIWAAKGCHKRDTDLPLSSSASCPISQPLLNTVGVFAGNVYTYADGSTAIVMDSCAWNLPVADVQPADMVWLGQQPVTCPLAQGNSTRTTCPGGAKKPLPCTECRSVTSCGSTGDCVRNPCGECTSRVEVDGQVQCGAAGGSSLEAQCPTCAVDACSTQSRITLRDAGCKEWKTARTCVADPCRGCNAARWLNFNGQQVHLTQHAARHEHTMTRSHHHNSFNCINHHPHTRCARSNRLPTCASTGRAQASTRSAMLPPCWVTVCWAAPAGPSQDAPMQASACPCSTLWRAATSTASAKT